MTMDESKNNAGMPECPAWPLAAGAVAQLGGSGAGQGEVGESGARKRFSANSSKSRDHAKRQVGARRATCNCLVGRETAGVSSAQTASGIALRGLCLASSDASIGDRGMASSCPMIPDSGIVK